MQCVILAGGLGTRLGMFTRDTPKNLIPVAGRPFADYQLSWLAAHGVSHIVYCIGHLGDLIGGRTAVFGPDGICDGLDAGLLIELLCHQ